MRTIPVTDVVEPYFFFVSRAWWFKRWRPRRCWRTSFNAIHPDGDLVMRWRVKGTSRDQTIAYAKQLSRKLKARNWEIV